MRNSKLILFLLVIFSIQVFGKDIDRNYAERVAKHFYHQQTGIQEQLILLQLVEANKTRSGVGRVSDNSPVYYIFNVNNNGFVLVSGDDLVQPVLGYGTEGNFTSENLAPATRKWIDNYASQILYVKENITETTAEITKQWYNYYHNINDYEPGPLRDANAVSPLVAQKWNQSPYENALCPYDPMYGERTVSGCVATAMAMLMKYWNYPAQGTGFHSYNDRNYGTQNANFGSTTYQWNQMPNYLSSPNQAVATLMYHCGVAVEMNYGVGATGGSAAYVVSSQSPILACSEYAYKTYFGYDPSTLRGVERRNYSDVNWVNLLKTELDNSRPLQYAGIGQGGGHTWVCDGYDNNNFFHMNWGWGGNSDGYFSLNSLDPTSLGAGGGTGGFNSNQQAVIGLKPIGGGGGGGGGTTINQDGIQLYSNIFVNANPIQSGNQLTVTVDIANAGTTAFTGDFAAALFNSEGVFVDFIQEYTNETVFPGYYITVPFTKNQLSAIPGQYVIGIFYKNGNNNYSLINPTQYANPVGITVTGTFSNIQMGGNTAFTPSTLIQGQSFSIDTKIGNAGGSNFSGYLSADLFTIEGDYVGVIQEFGGANLNAQTLYDVQFSSNGLNVSPGTYYVAFFSSPDNNNWTLVYGDNFPNPVTVTITEQPLAPDMYENNNTENAAYPLNVNFSGNTANINTQGSNIHVGNDYDYYKINLPSGSSYNITARVHDSYNSGNGQNYTNDVQFSYKVNGGASSDSYDDVMPGQINVSDGGTVIFFVAPYYTGTTGTYLLDLHISRGTTGIAGKDMLPLTVFPNPAKNELFIDAGNLPDSSYELDIFSILGASVKNEKGFLHSSEILKTDVSFLPAGIYSVQIKTKNITAVSKLIIE